jgi:threonine aldolase
MREAMAKASVGDDVYGEDPTVNRLQEMAAELMGKEAALFVASGTMGNLSAILSHCGRGDEIIIGDKAHSYLLEAGGVSALGGVHTYSIPNQPDGILALEDIRLAIRQDDAHFPVTRLVALENTHNRCGGAVLSAAYLRQVGGLAHQYGLYLHLDGARIFNAAVALGVPARELAEPADSVTFCLSKALCAPVGSLLCGSREFIHRAHRVRKQLGGGMRQAGVLAAAGIVALESMIDRLAEDHARARDLALGLSSIPALHLDGGMPQSNMVFLSLSERAPLDASQLAAALAQRGLRVGVVSARRLRLVTHYYIRDADVQAALSAFREVVGGA